MRGRERDWCARGLPCWSSEGPGVTSECTAIGGCAFPPPSLVAQRNWECDEDRCVALQDGGLRTNDTGIKGMYEEREEEHDGFESCLVRKHQPGQVFSCQR